MIIAKNLHYYSKSLLERRISLRFNRRDTNSGSFSRSNHRAPTDTLVGEVN